MRVILAAVLTITVYITAVSSGNLIAEEAGKLSGKAYFEYLNPDNSTGDVTQFRFTRYYFTYDYNISDKIKIRYRLDADRKADDKMRPFMKHAYISWAELIPDAKLYIGMQMTPNWTSYSEKYWGYRSVEKTIQDLSGVGSSADLGVGLVGDFSNSVGYHLIYANGAGYSKPEKDNFKKTSGLIWFKPRSKFIGTLYLDYEPTGDQYSNSTITLFGGYDSDQFRVGIEYFMHKEGGAIDLKKNGISLFATLKMAAGNAFARYDISDPDTDTKGNGEDYIIIGYDYAPEKKFHILPNARIRKVGDRDWEKSIHVNFEFRF